MIRPPRSWDIRTVADADVMPRRTSSIPARAALIFIAIPRRWPEGRSPSGILAGKHARLSRAKVQAAGEERVTVLPGPQSPDDRGQTTVCQARLRSTMGRPPLGFSV